MGHLVAKQNALKCLRLNTLGGVGCPGKEASVVLLETVVSAVATSGAAGSQTVNHSGDPHEGKFSVVYDAGDSCSQTRFCVVFLCCWHP